MTYDYITSGTCSRRIRVELDGDTIVAVRFDGGCHGNTQGISALVPGMKIDEVISRCEGIHCGSKTSSCPDQLARALRAAKQAAEA